ncbi:MAG: hypothetical protein MZV70_70720 [Desulfobacterales bacterium]|nr:hypothetical protein [Desulfobacterales bacterium]
MRRSNTRTASRSDGSLGSLRDDGRDARRIGPAEGRQGPPRLEGRVRPGGGDRVLDRRVGARRSAAGRGRQAPRPGRERLRPARRHRRSQACRRRPRPGRPPSLRTSSAVCARSPVRSRPTPRPTANATDIRELVSAADGVFWRTAGDDAAADRAGARARRDHVLVPQAERRPQRQAHRQRRELRLAGPVRAGDRGRPAPATGAKGKRAPGLPELGIRKDPGPDADGPRLADGPGDLRLRAAPGRGSHLRSRPGRRRHRQGLAQALFPVRLLALRPSGPRFRRGAASRDRRGRCRGGGRAGRGRSRRGARRRGRHHPAPRHRGPARPS